MFLFSMYDIIMSQQLADLLFPEVTTTIDEIKTRYPRRPAGQVVTRFAPSPTGFMHIGAIYASLVSQRIAAQQNGVFMLRIEDTDQERKIDNGRALILQGLANFGIVINE